MSICLGRQSCWGCDDKKFELEILVLSVLCIAKAYKVWVSLTVLHLIA